MYWLTKSVLMATLLALPAAAAAQTTGVFVSPYIGATVGGGDLSKEGAATGGVAAGWMGGRWGLEADLAETNGFFEQDDFRTERRVTTGMASGLFRVPIAAEGALSAYAVGGLGTMKTRLAEAGNLARIDLTQSAFNVGGGLMWMRDRVGVRGDVRYLRAFGDEADDANAFGLEVSTLSFVRLSLGLVVGF
jgi:hypothetical protein